MYTSHATPIDSEPHLLVAYLADLSSCGIFNVLEARLSPSQPCQSWLKVLPCALKDRAPWITGREQES